MAAVSELALQVPLGGKIPGREYRRPDIVLERSMRDSSETIRTELKVLGDERSYGTSLRVIQTQAKQLLALSSELLDRFGRAGEEPSNGR